MKDKPDSQVLCWPGRLLSEEDLRRHLTSQNEILLAPKTVVTPLALDHLRDRRVRVRREGQTDGSAIKATSGAWSYAIETPDALVSSVIAALQREGVSLATLPGKNAVEWAKAVAGGATSGIVFVRDSNLVCCIGNKVRGVRAAAILNVTQAKRAKQSLSPNLVAVETPGPTFHEVRQIVRTVIGPASCPTDLARTLQELEGHAHR